MDCNKKEVGVYTTVGNNEGTYDAVSLTRL